MREKSIAQNAVVVGFMTLISRVGGLIREVLMAYYFGTDVLKSAFDVAYRAPNLFRRLFGEGALSAALIPIYTETLEKEGKAEADRLAPAVAGTMLAILSAICAVVMAATFPIARCLPADSSWQPILLLLRIMLPYAPLICLAALIMGVLNSLKSFALSALAPAFQNLCWIFVLLCVCPFLPEEGTVRIEAVSWSIVVSGIIQGAVQIPALRRHAVPIRLVFSRTMSPRVRRVFKLTLPMALAAGVVQLNVCLDGALAVWAAKWGPSALNYADRLVYLPLALVGTTFATVLLPTLSSLSAAGDDATFAATFERTARNVIAVLTPAAIGMIALATPTSALIYASGKFNATSTAQTTSALVAYSAGLVAAGLHKIVVTAFYARQDMRTPVIVSTLGVALNLTMNLFFIWILPTDLKPVGIAIATSISSFLACAVLLTILARRRTGVPLFAFASIRRVTIASTASAALMGVAAWWCARFVRDLLPPQWSVKALTAVCLVAAVPFGVAIYFALMRLLCPSALAELVQDFRRRRRR
jgi:putative peptidoglycan lipid II flippase